MMAAVSARNTTSSLEKASRIVVVNDAAVKDEMIIAGLKMAKPAGVKLSILSVKRAGEKFAAGEYRDDKVFLITKNIGDMADKGVEATAQMLPNESGQSILNML